MVMGMSVVFDIASEQVGKYPPDYPLCGSAVSRAAKEADNCESELWAALNPSDDDDSALGLVGTVALCVVATFVGTLLLVLGVLYMAGTSFIPTRHRTRRGDLLDTSASELRDIPSTRQGYVDDITDADREAGKVDVVNSPIV